MRKNYSLRYQFTGEQGVTHHKDHVTVRVFKYRGGDENIFNRDLESIENDSFWAPTRDALNDPCEGLVSPENLHQQIDILSGLSAKSSGKVDSAISNVKTSLNDVLEQKILVESIH